MKSQIGEVYYRKDIPVCEQELSFTGFETEFELRKMLLESEGIYQTMLIFTELRKRGATP